MNLEELRSVIDGIDDELLRLFVRRMEVVREVAEFKKSAGKSVADKSREREIMTRVIEAAPDSMDNIVKALFSTMFSLSRAYQSSYLAGQPAGQAGLSAKIGRALESTAALFPDKATVACQGAEGAYSQIACDKLFKTPNILYFSHFENVFQAVEKGLCRYGILPIENSFHGSVTQVYDLMREHDFHIARSIKMKINHSLLGRSGSRLSDIREIFSHEQAVWQCAAFLQKLDGVKVTACENTAMAAKAVAESGRSDAAAIASPECAGLYGLTRLQQDVQDSHSNFTRFICISKELEIYPGADKISLMLSLEHRPGSLFELMSKFSALGLNLTKLESRPIADRDFEFMFYFDLDGSVREEAVLKLMGELSADTERFVFLGNYSEK
ncbi:MAG: chorismate mutase [Oscillospiraceae bacterium]|nr:chorismate mutase [Oscillospiraceae bacterium]